MRVDPNHPHILYMFARTRCLARYRGCEMNLTREFIADLCQQNCYYCGNPPAQKGRAGVRYNGIDRFNNLGGYTMDNCVPACGTCNRWKREEEFPDFIDTARRIVRKWGMYGDEKEVKSCQ